MQPPRPCAVELHEVTRRFGTVAALDRVSLSIHQGEFFSLLGPSGCGKTTLLRVIAGLETTDSGTVKIAGLDAQNIPAHRRPVNTVFQSYALFPHLDVRQNIAFGLRMRKTPSPEIDRRVDAVSSLVQVADLVDRRTHQLSGGQKQRVALARALVNEPSVLLLDEPLAALDVKLRKTLQTELRNLQRRLGITFIYVTHDQEEALVLSDRIALMHNGAIHQVGQGRELYENPRTRFASQFLGSCNLLEGTLSHNNPQQLLVETALGTLSVKASTPPRQQLTLAIRPEKILLLPDASPHGENQIPVKVESIVYAGSETHYELSANSRFLRAEIMNTTHAPRELRSGQAAVACLPPEALVILED